MRRLFVVFGVLSVFLSACSTVEHGPVTPNPAGGCAKPSGEDEKDGGLGGTGKAPRLCDDVAAP